jgi:vacuolar-type H+-ATPase subunit E/Vma4
MANLLEAEAALTSARNLLKSSDDYEWLYWNTDYLSRVDENIAEALKILSDLKAEASCVGGVTIRL